jgi:hypothetical protein
LTNYLISRIGSALPKLKTAFYRSHFGHCVVSGYHIFTDYRHHNVKNTIEAENVLTRPKVETAPHILLGNGGMRSQSLVILIILLLNPSYCSFIRDEMSMASKFEFSKKSDVSKGRPPPVINRKAPEKI